MNSATPNPIAMRDLVIDESNRFVIDGAIATLIDRGWPVQAICAELPGVSEADVRRVGVQRARAA